MQDLLQDERNDCQDVEGQEHLLSASLDDSPTVKGAQCFADLGEEVNDC